MTSSCKCPIPCSMFSFPVAWGQLPEVYVSLTAFCQLYYYIWTNSQLAWIDSINRRLQSSSKDVRSQDTHTEQRHEPQNHPRSQGLFLPRPPLAGEKALGTRMPQNEMFGEDKSPKPRLWDPPPYQRDIKCYHPKEIVLNLVCQTHAVFPICQLRFPQIANTRARSFGPIPE